MTDFIPVVFFFQAIIADKKKMKSWKANLDCLRYNVQFDLLR